jgi:hypothetical protein
MSWAQGPGGNKFSFLRSLNFNTFMGNNVSPAEQAQAAAAAGGYCVVQSTSDAEVVAARGHSSILAWHHSDEPDAPQGSSPKIAPSTIASRYQWYQGRNIDRPVFVTFTANFMAEFRGKYSAQQQAALYPQYIDDAEVVGFDTYPIYGFGRENWLNRPASGTAQLKAIAGGRPVYAWIETSKGSKWMTYAKQPDVLPIHTRYEVWGSLIEGATAIGYFTHAWQPSFTEFAPTAAMQAELYRLNGQITDLAPAILAAPSRREIQMALTSDYGLSLTSRLKATDYGGALWIFAQNSDLGPNAEQLGQFDPISPRAGRATITVEGLRAGDIILRVEDVGYTPIAAGDGFFEDDFTALGEHVYMIVPEPACLILLASAALALPRRRRA